MRARRMTAPATASAATSAPLPPLELRARLHETQNGACAVDLVASGCTLLVDKHTVVTDTANAAVALRELELLLAVRGAPHVVQLERAALQDERLHLLLEHCAGGDLLQQLQQQRRLQAAGLEPQDDNVCVASDAGRRRIFRDVLRGVQSLHAAGIAHLDLSPENVFLSADGVAKVGDLGHAQRFDRRSVRAPVVAKEAYAAPEMLAGGQVADLRQADAWSLGVVLWTLCTQRSLLSRAAPDDAFFRRMTRHGSMRALQDTGLLHSAPAGLVDLLARLLHVDPAGRLSVSAALQHSWVLGTQKKCLDKPRLLARRGSSTGASLKGARSRTASAEIPLQHTRVPISHVANT